MAQSGPHIPNLRAPFYFVSEEERKQRLEVIQSTRPAGPLWIFAFGSLMWNPCYEFDRREVADFAGWERKFHIWTTLARGTPETPGLGLCIEQSELSCRGIVYRLLAENEGEDWMALWDREMVSGIYQAIWADVKLETGDSIKALTFVVDKAHPQYAGGMSVSDMAKIIAGAEGKYGRCSDYLASTVEEMAKIDVIDEYLNELLAAVNSHLT